MTIVESDARPVESDEESHRFDYLQLKGQLLIGPDYDAIQHLVQLRDTSDIDSDPAPIASEIGEMIQEIDAQLWGLAGEPDSPLVRAFPQDSPVVTSLTGEVARIVSESANESSSHDVVVTSMLWGSMIGHIGIHEKLRPAQGLKQRVFVVELPGYDDADTLGDISLVGELPEAVVAADSVVFHDDIVDTAMHFAEFVRLRLAGRGEDTDEIDTVITDLQEGLKREEEEGQPFTDQRFEKFDAIYKRLAEQVCCAGVVVAVPFYKNTPFHDHLQRAASLNTDEAHDRWASIQLGFLTDELRAHIPATQWVMGEGLDTKVDGAGIVTYIRGVYSPEDISVEMERTLHVLEHCKLRIGSTVRGLVALEGDVGQFFTWLYQQFDKMITGHLAGSNAS